MHERRRAGRRVAVIMAGGSGTRFWPQSRRQMPKQFLRMTGNETLIQQAANRCHPAISEERTWIVTGAAHAVETSRQLPLIPAQQILVEPCGRNTAPCIGWAVRTLPGGEAFRAAMNTLDTCDAQIAAVATFFDQLGEQHVLLPSTTSAANDDALELAA